MYSSFCKLGIFKRRTRQTHRKLLCTCASPFTLSITICNTEENTFLLTSHLFPLACNRFALCVATYLLGTFISKLMHEVSHFFVVLFPLLGALFLLTLIPVAAYASYPADFLGLNLVNPKHFFYIAKKTWGSMKQNDLKVKSKDL